jgi:hypothetical protein
MSEVRSWMGEGTEMAGVQEGDEWRREAAAQRRSGGGEAGAETRKWWRVEKRGECGSSAGAEWRRTRGEEERSGDDMAVAECALCTSTPNSADGKKRERERGSSARREARGRRRRHNRRGVACNSKPDLRCGGTVLRDTARHF